MFLDEIDKIATPRRSRTAPTCRARACSATCCRWSRARRSTPSTAWSAPTTSCSSPSGAFHLSKPSDLIPELQGRFPIRVELDSLSVADFEQILTDTDACLTRQYEALLATEGVHARVHRRRHRRLAEIAFAVNEKTENIGARRLYTVMERLLEEVSFSRRQRARGETVRIDAAYVDARLADARGATRISRATCCSARAYSISLTRAPAGARPFILGRHAGPVSGRPMPAP